MTGDVEPVGIAAELIGILVNPGDGVAHLFGHSHQIAGDIVDIVEVDHHAVATGIDDRLRVEGEVSGAAVPPGPAMDIDVDGRVRGFAAVDVHALDLGCAILEALRHTEPGACPR